MNDISDDFKERLKKKKKGLEVNSNPLSLFESISEEMESEIESNKSLKFKRSLNESRKTVDTKSKLDLTGLFTELSVIKEEDKILDIKKDEVLNFFSLLSENQEPLGQEFTEILNENLPELYESEEIIEETPIVEEVLIQVENKEDLISAAVKSISKEEALKPQDNVPEDYTNLFSNPEVTKTDPNIKALQTKLKFLEEWISKISMTGPGGGSGSILDLDKPTKTVYTNYTLDRKDYYVGVNSPIECYITLPLMGHNVYNGRTVVVKDESGNCQNNPIHILGNIDNDEGGAILQMNNGALQFIYNNGWKII